MNVRLIHAETFLPHRAIAEVELDGQRLMAMVYVTEGLFTEEKCRTILVEKFAAGDYVNWAHADNGVDPSRTFCFHPGGSDVGGVYPFAITLAHKPYPKQPPLAVS